MLEEKDCRIAPDGFIWVCRYCGKKAEDRYGLDGWHDYGWDESCMLNAELAKRELSMARGPSEE